MSTVSVVIVNWNGGETVLRVLRSIARLDWPELDILVVDNCSIDGSPDEIEREFIGRVHVIRRSLNSVTAARNEGFRNARGEFIISLDNDIELLDPGTVKSGLTVFDQFPDVGALAFRIGGERSPTVPLAEHWWHPVSLEKGREQFFYTDFFGEGGVMFRGSALEMIGGYDEDYFQGAESDDLMLRLLSAGYQILYCPILTCIELRVRGVQWKTRSRINYLSLRNKLWTVWKNYPIGRGSLYAGTRLIAGLTRAARYGWLDLWVRAAIEGLFAPERIRRKRRVLTSAVWRRFDEIRSGRCLIGPSIE
jgi:GT2 family glycosyltransferase